MAPRAERAAEFRLTRRCRPEFANGGCFKDVRMAAQRGWVTRDAGRRRAGFSQNRSWRDRRKPCVEKADFAVRGFKASPTARNSFSHSPITEIEAPTVEGKANVVDGCSGCWARIPPRACAETQMMARAYSKDQAAERRRNVGITLASITPPREDGTRSMNLDVDEVLSADGCFATAPAI